MCEGTPIPSERLSPAPSPISPHVPTSQVCNFLQPRTSQVLHVCLIIVLPPSTSILPHHLARTHASVTHAMDCHLPGHAFSPLAQPRPSAPPCAGVELSKGTLRPPLTYSTLGPFGLLGSPFKGPLWARRFPFTLCWELLKELPQGRPANFCF
jgi:hypothetical protein